MKRSEQISIFFWSILHLRPAMIYWRVHRTVKGALFQRFARTAIAQRLLAPKLGAIDHAMVPFLDPVTGCEEIVPARRVFTFLNDRETLPAERSTRVAAIAAKPLLWQFHYSYHDYLPALLRDGKATLDEALACVEEWTGDFPPLSPGAWNAAWHPYVLSIRIESWVRLHAALGDDPSRDAGRQLLARGIERMTRTLLRNLEYGTMANHLLRNVKALVLAGLFLRNATGRKAWRKGMMLLRREIVEQVLDDGMHFERTPMYHAAVSSDVFDLIEALERSGRDVPRTLLSASERMTAFLGHILHPDGDVPYFNDSTASVFLQPRDVLARGEAVRDAHGLAASDPRPTREMLRVPKHVSGLLVHRAGDLFLVFDGGQVGPDYQPGHAHCDTLSYELSWKGRRLVTDTGVYQYRESPERSYSRSTAAHSTVRIDSRDQSEVWKSFRVGRRANIVVADAWEEHGCTFFRAAHDGYGRFAKGLLHERCIAAKGDAWMVVADFIHGEGRHFIESIVHFAPGVALKREGRTLGITTAAGRSALHASGAENMRIFDTESYPAFGVRVMRKTLVMHTMATLPWIAAYMFVFSGAAPLLDIDAANLRVEIRDAGAPSHTLVSSLGGLSIPA